MIVVSPPLPAKKAKVTAILIPIVRETWFVEPIIVPATFLMMVMTAAKVKKVFIFWAGPPTQASWVSDEISAGTGVEEDEPYFPA